MAVALIGLLTLTACGASQDSAGISSSASGSPSAPGSSGSPSPTVPSVPTDGVTLGQLGFTHGPLDTFSLPATLAISTRVDQPNAVTVVITSPTLTDLADYLRRALPATGYAITAQAPAGTMTFTGHGWAGSVTGDDGIAAVTLSPVP